MSSFIQEAVDRKYSKFEEGLKETYKAETSKTLTGEQLGEQLREMRSVEKPTNWFMWMRAHKGRGVAATWKDLSFFPYILKELPKSRTAPWVWGGVSTFVFGYLAFNRPRSEHVESINFYPHGSPPGSKLNAHYEHLIHIDLGEPVLHKNPTGISTANKHHGH